MPEGMFGVLSRALGRLSFMKPGKSAPQPPWIVLSHCLEMTYAGGFPDLISRELEQNKRSSAVAEGPAPARACNPLCLSPSTMKDSRRERVPHFGTFLILLVELPPPSVASRRCRGRAVARRGRAVARRGRAVARRGYGQAHARKSPLQAGRRCSAGHTARRIGDVLHTHARLEMP